MKPFDYVEIRLPAKPQYVSVARLTISGLANRMGFSYDDIEDLKIAASEAITNAVQHAYAEDEDGEVVIGCALYSDRIEIMIADHGKSFNFEETKAQVGPYHDLEEGSFLREGGLGLYLIETLMDEVKVHHQEGVTVFMTKHVGVKQVDDNVEHISS
ncbi:anti-sigma B factor RsbW [Psychrobacillus sp. FSL W7-1457]|mgnify:CR=1 FL=1|uniref:anti-sigma B factor RsbW n=1 Tax=unclassified Psychrobacillus TaxID=2636677 RepID=UPI0020406AAE|nr:anti-sigma B factor RsbW [Psychrobacillus sp. MER TA 171]MCM3357645.1 anti-sigma B factor RsbW [Psychrobacillus sp. MER TA 171]